MNKPIYPYNILFIEDEKAIRDNFVTYLKIFFQNVYEAADGLEGYEVYKEKKPDILIIDINLPHLNGLELLKKIREKDHNTKAILLTAYTDKKFLLEASSLKLIRYLTKPVSRDELEETLQLTVKELQSYRINPIQKIELKGNYNWDIDRKTLFYFNKEVNLTPNEKSFLELLFSSLERTFTYDEITYHIWDYSENDTKNAMKSLVNKLRKKLPEGIITNVFSTGYKIDFQK